MAAPPGATAGDPLNAQAYKTQRADSPEDLWQPLYDRVNVANATTIGSQVAYFSIPLGQAAPLIVGTAINLTKVKTYRDTNMNSANVVPTKLFKFVGISMAIVHATRQSLTNPADADLIMDGGYFQFRIVDKDLLFLPLLNFPLLNPVGALSTTANNTTTSANQYGGGAGIVMYKLPINITLNPYENFQATMNFDTAATLTLTLATDMYCVMQGFQRRPT